MLVKIKRITNYSEKLARDVDSLFRELSLEGNRMKTADLKSALKDKTHTHLVGLFDGKELVGMATISLIHAVSGTSAYLDDVVVKQTYRGKGLGEKLVREMVRLAKKLKADDMEFTSRRSRIAANKLYQKMGFHLKDSNAYKMKF